MADGFGAELRAPWRAGSGTGVPDAAPAEVPRQRLTAIFDQGPPIVVLTALPGHGATTAVAQWARRTAQPVSWLTVTPGAAPSSFWSDLDAAVQRLVERRECHADDPDPAPLGTLVLDGLQPLGGDRSGRDLGRALERLSEWLRVVVTADVDLDLPITSWRARGLVHAVSGRELAFDGNEALRLAELLAPGLLSDEEVLALNHRVAGWPIALATSLRAIREAKHPEHVRALLGMPHGVMHDHVAREVIGRLEPELHDPTMCVAVADRIDADAAHLLLGDRASELVGRLRREQIVGPVDEQPGAVELHPVVRDVLLARLDWADPSRGRALHRQVAELCASRGRLDQAFRHLVAAGSGTRPRDSSWSPRWRCTTTGTAPARRRCSGR